MNIQPTANDRSTVELWLPEHLLEIARSFDGWHLVAMSLPEGVGRTGGIKVSKIKSIDLGSIRLKTLMQSSVEVKVDAVVGLSVYISADDVEASSEARYWVGDVEPGFVGAYVDFDSSVCLRLELELLKQPPMVLTSRLVGIDGESSVSIRG